MKTSRLIVLLPLAIGLASCGGGAGTSNSTPPSPTSTTYTIGGRISGLTGTGLVLQDNGGDDLSVAAGATSFTFPTALASGSSYNVTVLTQPSNPAQTCTVILHTYQREWNCCRQYHECWCDLYDNILHAVSNRWNSQRIERHASVTQQP